MHGAITILNATATGHGAALAVEGGVEATWTVTDGEGLDWQTPDMDDRLVRAVHTILIERYGLAVGGVARTASMFPPSRGLKTSSSAAAALMQAGAQAGGVSLSVEKLVKRAVQAAVGAGVTLTGAFDDQVAVVQGGCHLTDNPSGAVLAAIPVEPWDVAVWVPNHAIDKADVAGIDATVIAKKIHKAEQALIDGDVPLALALNGRAFTTLYQAAGLPVHTEPVDDALRCGALAAGLSGTGPAVAALFDSMVDLPETQGGKWQWTKVVQ